MKVAVPAWQGRISPVFDAASTLLVIDAENGCETHREETTLAQCGPFERARAIGELGVQTLICGAVSRPLEMALRSAQVQVIPDICGNTEEVLVAYLAGKLDQEVYGMPGCCGRRRGMGAGRRAGRMQRRGCGPRGGNKNARWR